MPIQCIKAPCFVTKATGRHAGKITNCVQNLNENGIMVDVYKNAMPAYEVRNSRNKPQTPARIPHNSNPGKR